MWDQVWWDLFGPRNEVGERGCLRIPAPVGGLPSPADVVNAASDMLRFGYDVGVKWPTEIPDIPRGYLRHKDWNKIRFRDCGLCTREDRSVVRVSVLIWGAIECWWERSDLPDAYEVVRTINRMLDRSARTNWALELVVRVDPEPVSIDL